MYCSHTTMKNVYIVNIVTTQPWKLEKSILNRAVEPDFKKSNKKPDAKVGYRRLYPTFAVKAADVLAG